MSCYLCKHRKMSRIWLKKDAKLENRVLTYFNKELVVQNIQDE